MQADRLNDNKYLNWVRTSLSLLYLKEGIAGFNNEKAAALHRAITKRVLLADPRAATATCQTCTPRSAVKTKTKDRKSTTWTVNCQGNICNVWLEHILPYHKHAPCPNIAWANSGPRLWPAHGWEVAKLFQPFGCESHSKAEDSDCTALLTMMQDCTFFHSFLSNTAVLQEIKEVRNTCMHSNDLEVTDADMRRGLDLMISLLEETDLKNRQPCVEAKCKIEQLRDNILDLSLNKELELKALIYKLAEVRKDADNLAAEHQQLQSDMGEISTRQDSTVEECRQLSEQIQNIGREITEKYERSVKQFGSGRDAESRLFTKDIKRNNEDIKQMMVSTSSVSSEVADLGDRLQEIEKSCREDIRKIKENFQFTMKTFESRQHDQETRKAEEQQRQDENVKCVQRKLISLYDKHCQRVPIYPMRPSWRKRVEDLYVKPNMQVEDPDGRGRAWRDEIVAEKVNKVSDMFFSEGEFCRDIYISAEAGCGKTTLCEHLVNLWVRSQTGPFPLPEDESFMRMFTFLFYVSLREANKRYVECHRVENMIASQLQLPEFEVSRLVTDFNCLVILDGLDEVTKKYGSEITRFGNQYLPERSYSDNCTVITTSRPWKLELLARELEGRIERLISIAGLDHASQLDLTNNVVSLLNAKYRKLKNGNEFLGDMKRQNLTEYLETPVLLMQMLGLWYSDKTLGNSKCAIYSDIIEKQIEFTEKIRGMSQDVQRNDADLQDRLPACFTDKVYCKKYTPMLSKLSKLAFERLFDKNRESVLVFDHDETDICGMRDDEVKQLLHMGLLTQHKVFGELVEELKSISFLHKSHQEFLAAVYISTKCQKSDLSRLFSDIICDLNRVFEIENIFLFVCGLNSKVAEELSMHMMEKVSADPRVHEYRHSVVDTSRLTGLIEKIQKIILAGANEASKNDKHVAGLLKLQDILVWEGHIKAEEAMACDTTQAKSIVIGAPVYSEKYVDAKTWPQSSCIEKIELFRVNVACAVEQFQAFSADRLSVLQLLNVEMPHEHIAILCDRLSTADNLRKVHIVELFCKTHREQEQQCGFYLDLSRHKRLQWLGLREIHTGEINCIRMCPDMNNLEIIWLREVQISSECFRSLIESLPNCKVKLEIQPVILRDETEAKEMIDQIRQSSDVNVLKDDVIHTNDEYRVTLVYKYL